MNLPTLPGDEAKGLPPAEGEQRPLLAKVAVGLALLTFLIFLPVVECEFINYDDDVFVTNNPKVAAGFTWEGIKWAFTSADIDYWRPLSWLSHMLDIELFGAMAGGHHLTNLLIHCAAVVMCFIALHRLTREIWPSALVAALFAWHPLHVESVAWVAERKDVLCGFFWFLTIWAYARYCAAPSPRTYLTVFAGFILGIMSKPMVVTLPCVLLLLDFWPLNRLDVLNLEAWRADSWRRSLGLCWARVKEKLPMFAVVALLSLSTIYAQHKVGTMTSLDALSMEFRLVNAVTAYGTYLVQTFLPTNLCVIYPLSPAPHHRWILSSLLLVSVSLGAVVWLRKCPWVLVGWLWFLGVTLPVVGIMQVGVQAHADRYTYLPLVGIFLALVWSFWNWARRSPIGIRRFAIGAGAVLAICAALTRQQTSLWVNSGVLFEHAARHTQNNDVALLNWGAHLLGAEKRPIEALAAFQLAFRAKPDPMTWINIGLCYSELKQHPRALAAMAQAIAMGPNTREMNELEVALQNDLRARPGAHDSRKVLAMLYMARKDYAAAHAQLQTVIDSVPDDLDARVNQAAYLAVSGNERQAIVALEAAVKLAPTNSIAHSNLGALLAKAGRSDEALRHHEAAVRADPTNWDSRYNFALFLLRTGKSKAAKEEFETILQKTSLHLPAMQQLAWLLATQSEFRDGPRARALAETFMDRSTRWPSGHYDLMAAASAADGDFPNARLFAEKALQLAAEERRFVFANAVRQRLRLYQANQPYSEGSN
ncbi:MAG: tetratricopeptide repeat protein [Verrucomicrobia bacterium]|nr:tetratricopeptide repeat protein [Verrucomicrobiota bacterium]